MLVEDFCGNDCQGRVSHPCAIMSRADFSEFVLSDTIHGLFIGLRVVLDGNLCSHTSHSMYTATMASFDEKSNVGIHERDGHSDSRSIWEDKIGILSELLDDGEDIVPATTVEAGGMIAEFVNDLVHLKCGGDGLDENSTSDRAPWHADVVLRQVKNVVP